MSTRALYNKTVSDNRRHMCYCMRRRRQWLTDAPTHKNQLMNAPKLSITVEESNVVMFVVSLLALLLPLSTNAIPIPNRLIGSPEVNCGENQVDLLWTTENPFGGRVFAIGHADDADCFIEAEQPLTTTVLFSIPKSKCGVTNTTVPDQGLYVNFRVMVSFHKNFITKVDRVSVGLVVSLRGVNNAQLLELSICLRAKSDFLAKSFQKADENLQRPSCYYHRNAKIISGLRGQLFLHGNREDSHIPNHSQVYISSFANYFLLFNSPKTLSMKELEGFTFNGEMPLCRYEVLDAETQLPATVVSVGDTLLHRWSCASNAPSKSYALQSHRLRVSHNPHYCSKVLFCNLHYNHSI